MNSKQLHTLLTRLSGHFIAKTQTEEKEVERLHQSLSRSLLFEDIGGIKNSNFAFENADIFLPEDVPSPISDALKSIAEIKVAEGVEPEFRVSLREVPFRSTQAHASLPLWAGGAAVSHTVGPFTHKDGRKFWFDFFRIEKLVALYLQGNSHPALLFKVNLGLKIIDAALPPVTEALPFYKLPAGSIWINSQLLATGAPPGFFTGLTIKGGTITLSAPPQLINGKLTLAPNTKVDVKLQLQQPAVTDADPSSPYGIDARNAELELPENLSFHFSGAGSALDEISDAQWKVYGHQASFEWISQQPAQYDNLLHRVLIPFNCSKLDFEVNDCQSPFHTLRGKAEISQGAWALPAATIDILHPTPASGIGALLVRCKKGLTAVWKGLNGGELNLNQPYLMAEPGRIGLTDPSAGNLFCNQTFKLWKDEANTFGTSVLFQYLKSSPFFYNTFAGGIEALSVTGDADFQIDRPVTVRGEALPIRSKNSLLLLAVSKNFKIIYLFDDNILFESIDFTQKAPALPKPISLALRNALFKVTPVNGCLLFGELADDFIKVNKGFLFLTFGMYAYLPTLPDPYAANIGGLKFQFRGSRGDFNTGASVGGQQIWLWLICQVKWEATAPHDKVEVSFHFAPLQNQFQLMQQNNEDSDSFNHGEHGGEGENQTHQSPRDPRDPRGSVLGINIFSDLDAPVLLSSESAPETAFAVSGAIADNSLPDYGVIWDGLTGRLRSELFALLDVSTNADLLGISFNVFGDRRMAMVATHRVATPAAQAASGFSLQVRGMDVISQGQNARVFTVPQISWEPVINLSQKFLKFDPPPGFNYYEDDGGPTRISSFSTEVVPLAPIPLSSFIVDSYNEGNIPTWSLFTLPFGLRALTVITSKLQAPDNATLDFNAPIFEGELAGGIQIKMEAGQVPEPGESNRFPMGYTVQTCNVLDVNGQKTVVTQDGTLSGFSTLGQSVTEIFNNEFLIDPQKQNNFRGIPLERIDFAGYGSSIFSHWLNPNAVVAKTSQAKFDVWVGRTGHEVIQVRSILYPWGIRVVRTITLLRAMTGYVYRIDSGWRAESDGNFDFSYKVYIKKPSNEVVVEDRASKYEVHPGVIKKLVNIKEIIETDKIEPFTATWKKTNADTYVDVNGYEIKVSDITDPKEKDNITNPAGPNVKLQPVYFNADVLIENATQGSNGQVEETISGNKYNFGKVSSKGILGFVQIAPSGEPIPVEILKQLIVSQGGSIGGPIDCIVDIGKSTQQIRLNRLDVSNSFAANGSSPIFVAAGRGNVILPKDGSWSMVKHQRGTGEVSPVPDNLSVPLVRIGKLIKQGEKLVLAEDPADQLLRIADPGEILRQAVNETVNYGFLLSTDTQKALFLTPSFKHGLTKLLSKTPPLFADAFRIVNSKAVFPNVGNADNNVGDVINLVKNGNEFIQSALTDGGKKVFELMQINKVVGDVKEEGYKLLKQVTDFKLPDKEWNLIEIGSAFKIYIEYKASNVQTPKPPPNDKKNLAGNLNFDVDSFAGNVADKWKSSMSNVAIVVDLGPIKRLMTIKGNWDAKKGAEASYKGSNTDPDFPSPQIEFAKELQPVIDILQILQDLQGENYKEAVQKGLKLAMSNKAGTWEYKFEASKEIPVLRFPMPEFAYNDPNAPLKLEAGLKLGAYFNAALKVTTDPKQLLPTAGGFLGFYGRLSVMCVSLSVATVYAVGQVNLDIGADTKTGPMLRLKFGFGAQLVVGLPVVGNVSVLYMVGVEIYVDSTKLNISAFLLFQGHAELLAGLVSVTITIEAKGTISRDSSINRTDLAAQVTFGLDISIFLVINISFSTSWQEQRQIA